MENANKFTEKDRQNLVSIGIGVIVLGAIAFIISLFGFWGAIGLICLYITYKLFLT